MATEKDDAIRLANRVLDTPNRDPDDDLSMLSRQFLRALESRWQPIDTAPKDGSAFLAFGLHTGSPPSAQRGVVAGDHWWAIILWDVWRDTGLAQSENRWVFAKDGERTWSEPTYWRRLPEPPVWSDDEDHYEGENTVKVEVTDPHIWWHRKP